MSGATRVPREPYPGLRPFLAHEAALLFGRERQVREVIGHLRDTQFVAVLGGSGSGKSSLIHAGVTPELRSFGIPGAGDFWVSMTCTPGTNVQLAPGAQARYTPVTRLAWKFAALLKSRGSAEADRARLDEIANVFRQEAGFARLLDAYGDELDVPPGPDSNEARLLFVIDQFEEIFHPTNRDVADAGVLVERVIDHFFAPHPRAYVVLTMRSEHLNDCATYLELPDAINRASYLIRRLDDDELRDAIVGPAQRFLRLMARTGETTALPDEVRFEPAVLVRLLDDARAITSDPDHLPLLQHLLARLWQAARAREGGTSPVPAVVTLDDLERASGTPRGERRNLLRASLEHWAEQAWRSIPEGARPGMDALLRHLAFKDPGTGMYTQQRVNVADAPRLLGAGATPADLRALIEDRFVGNVDYLFWDDEDASRITLKVSHESMIRGWARFRTLIDAEAERFEEFAATMRRCAAWAERGRESTRLLEANDLRRLRDLGVDRTLRDADERAIWLRFLLQDRDGRRLAAQAPLVDGFIARSAARVRWTRTAMGSVVGVLAGVIVAFIAFVVLVQSPTNKRVLLYYDAGTLANRSGNTVFEPEEGRADLQRLRQAAGLVERGRSGEGVLFAAPSRALLAGLGSLGWVRRYRDLLDGVAGVVEPAVNGRLRDAVGSSLWPDPGTEGTAFPAQPVQEGALCTVSSGGLAGRALVGQLFRGSDAVTGAVRALFVPALEAGDDAIRIFDADPRPGDCRTLKQLRSIPAEQRPRLVIDATLRFVFESLAPRDDALAVTVFEIGWSVVGDHSSADYPAERAVVLAGDVAAAVRSASGRDGAAAMAPSWRTRTGRSFEIGGRRWQIGSMAAQRLDDAVVDSFQPLPPAPPDSRCAWLSAAEPAPGGFTRKVFAHRAQCLFVDERQAADGESRPVWVKVYAEPHGGSAAEVLQDVQARRPTPVANLPQYARPARATADWRVGTTGENEGWLAFRTTGRSGQRVALGAPWSTCALARQAGLLLADPKDPCAPATVAP